MCLHSILVHSPGARSSARIVSQSSAIAALTTISTCSPVDVINDAVHALPGKDGMSNAQVWQSGGFSLLMHSGCVHWPESMIMVSPRPSRKFGIVTYTRIVSPGAGQSSGPPQ